MSSLTDVFLRHYRGIGFLSLRTGSRDVAAGLRAQDTWIKLAEFRTGRALTTDRAYVFRVAASIATDWHRRRSRELAATADYAASRPALHEPDAPRRGRRARMLRRLEKALLAQPRTAAWMSLCCTGMKA